MFLVAAVLLTPDAALAEDYVITQAYVHAFSNDVTVYTSVFALNKDFSLNTSVYTKYTVDIIGAGIAGGGGGDATSSASSAAAGGGSDTRHEITAGVTHNFPGLIGVDLYYDLSREQDYKSSTPTISLKKELFNKNTTITAGYSRNDDEISGKYMASSDTRTTDNYYLGFTQVISPVTIVQVGYSLMNSSGYHAEGIRLVPVDGVLASTCLAESPTCMDEVFPTKRKRTAYIIGMNHHFVKNPERGGIAGKILNNATSKFTFRYYDDDWDIRAYTAEIEHYKPLSDANMLRVNYRFYTQSETFFFKDDKHLSTDLFLTSSPQHRDFNSHLIGFKLTHKLKRRTATSPLELSNVSVKYEFYVDSSRVSAHIFMGSLKFLF